MGNLVLTCYSESIHNYNDPLTGYVWKVEFYDKQGTPSADTGTIKKLQLRTNGPSKSLFKQFVVPRSCSFELVITSAADDTFLDSIITGEELQFYIVVYKESTVEFRGYIQRENIFIPDIGYNNKTVSITATDMLGVLSHFEYKKLDDTAFTGTETLLQHLLNILKAARVDEMYGATDQFLEISPRFYESSMNDKINGDPMTQARLNHEAFTTFEERTRVEWTIIESPIPTINDIHFPTIIKLPNEPVNFSTCAEVLDQICFLQLAQMQQIRGIYTFKSIPQKVNLSYKRWVYLKDGTQDQYGNFSSNITVDQTLTYKKRGGNFTFLQPLKRVQIDHKLGAAINLLKGYTWDNFNNPLYSSIADISNAGNAKLSVSFVITPQTIEESTEYADGSRWWPHRFLFKIQIQIGAFYLKRTYTGDDRDGNPLYSDITWESSLNHVYVMSNIVGPVNYYEQPAANVILETPEILASGALSVRVELDSVIDFEGNTLPSDGQFSYTIPDEPPYNVDYYFSWKSYNNYIRVHSDDQEQNINARSFARYTTDIDLKHTEIFKREVTIGDDPDNTNFYKLQIYNGTSWVDSIEWQVLGAGTAYALNDLLSREIAALRADLRRLMIGEFICTERNIAPDTRLSYDSLIYIMISGNYDTHRETMAGEWIEINYETGKTTGKQKKTITDLIDTAPDKRDPLKPKPKPAVTVNKNPRDYEPYITKTSKPLSSGAITTLEINPSGFPIFAGDVIRILDPYTGNNEEIELLEDVGPNATEITVNKTLTHDYPNAAEVFTIPNRAQRKVYQRITGVTTAYITITVAPLPDPAKYSLAVMRRKMFNTFKGGNRLIYIDTGATFTRPWEFKVDKANERLTFLRALAASDVIETEFEPNVTI